MRIVIYGYTKSAMSYTNSTVFGMKTLVFDLQKLKVECKEKGNQKMRKYDGKDIVKIYSINFNGGYAFLYSNITPNLTYSEDIKWKLKNLEIKGHEGENEQSIEIGPGKEELVILSKIDANEGMSYSNSCSFGIRG